MTAILDWLDIFLIFSFKYLPVHNESALESVTKLYFVDVTKNGSSQLCKVSLKYLSQMTRKMVFLFLVFCRFWLTQQKFYTFSTAFTFYSEQIHALIKPDTAFYHSAKKQIKLQFNSKSVKFPYLKKILSLMPPTFLLKSISNHNVRLSKLVDTFSYIAANFVFLYFNSCGLETKINNSYLD